MSRYFTPFPALLARAIEGVLNATVALDPNSPEAVRRLTGRVLRFELEGLGIDLYFSAADDRLKVRAEREEEADTVITGTPAAFLAMASADNSGGPALQIRGDAGLAQDFQRLFKRLDPDWEAALSERFGSVLGPQLYQFLRQGSETTKTALDTGREQFAHWLKNESELVPNGDEWQRFVAGVDEFRDAVDRLEARLKRTGRE